MRKVRPQTHISQEECILRVWNIEGETHKICIEMNIQIQELEYVVRLQPEKNVPKDQFEDRFRRIMKVRQGGLNLNRQALPFNAVLFCMKDGYFASKELCDFLRAKHLLAPFDDFQTTTSVTVSSSNCILTSSAISTLP